MKKEYKTPAVRIVKVRLESIMIGGSIGDGEGTFEGADARENNIFLENADEGSSEWED